MVLRVGATSSPHTCIPVGHQGVSCNKCTGRLPKHHFLNEKIRKGFAFDRIPTILEPPPGKK